MLTPRIFRFGDLTVGIAHEPVPLGSTWKLTPSRFSWVFRLRPVPWSECNIRSISPRDRALIEINGAVATYPHQSFCRWSSLCLLFAWYGVNVSLVIAFTFHDPARVRLDDLRPSLK